MFKKKTDGYLLFRINNVCTIDTPYLFSNYFATVITANENKEYYIFKINIYIYCAFDINDN